MNIIEIYQDKAKVINDKAKAFKEDAYIDIEKALYASKTKGGTKIRVMNGATVDKKLLLDVMKNNDVVIYPYKSLTDTGEQYSWNVNIMNNTIRVVSNNNKKNTGTVSEESNDIIDKYAAEITELIRKILENGNLEFKRELFFVDATRVRRGTETIIRIDKFNAVRFIIDADKYEINKYTYKGIIQMRKIVKEAIDRGETIALINGSFIQTLK